jgi:hypothetical protein
VSHAKIASFHVKNTDKGNIAVKKYKTNRKLAQATSAHIVYAALAQHQMQDMGTVYIGYAYPDEYGNEEIYCASSSSPNSSFCAQRSHPR